MLKLEKGSTFLKVDDENSNKAYFDFTTEDALYRMSSFVLGAVNPNHLWHFYEVISQTVIPAEGTESDLNKLKDIVAEFISLDDFFTVLAHCSKVYLGGQDNYFKTFPKRASHFMQLARVYKVYKETGVFEFSYDKDEMKTFRRIPLSEWPESLQEELESLSQLMFADFDIDFDKYFADRLLKTEEIKLRIKELELA